MAARRRSSPRPSDARRTAPNRRTARSPYPSPIEGARMLGTRKRIQPDAPRSGATLEPAAMAAMFDDVAPTYDRLNTLMTLGSDVRWRRRAVDETHARLGDSVIDVCCGTGKLAAQVADRVGPFGRVEGVDLSP